MITGTTRTMNIAWSLFPKSYRNLSGGQLANLVQEVDLDTANVIIRKGFVVDEENISTHLVPYLKEAKAEGIKIVRASTMFNAEQICADPSPLAIMAQAGIQEFRMAWFPKEDSDVTGAIQRAKADMDRVAEACKKHRIRAIYQVHHNTLITSPTAAFYLVRGLPSAYIGIELDPGNQSFQGFEPWHYSAGLLGEYLSWVAIKDTTTWQERARISEPDKGWRRSFCPISEGVTNWHRLLDALREHQFDGTFVFMPFYDEDNDVLRTKKLKEEVAYLKLIVSEPA